MRRRKKKRVKKDNFLPSYNLWNIYATPDVWKTSKSFIAFPSDKMQNNKSFTSPLSAILWLCEPSSGLKGKPQLKKGKVQEGNKNLLWRIEHMSLFKKMFLFLLMGHFHLLLQAHLASAGLPQLPEQWNELSVQFDPQDVEVTKGSMEQKLGHYKNG